jgi:uncharacterized membrane protein YraQ (UPF0718 family)
MKEIIIKNKLSAIVISIYTVLFFLQTDMAISALHNSTYYLVEMAQILPVIFMLTVSIDVLVPKEWIIKRLGTKSGFSGSILALAFGSMSAGPIYAAFPIAKMLYKKGASINNIVIILSSWAVIKIPMLANEAKFLGPEFMAVRWVLTVIFIFIMGWLVEKSGIKISGANDENLNKMYINEEYCIGCTTCEKTMPELFAMKNGKAYIVNVEIDTENMKFQDKELLKKAAEKCPTNAIIID